MGQKVHPVGFRIGIIKTWNSKWFSDRSYGTLLHEDLNIKKFVKKRLAPAGVASVEIERAANKLRVNIAAARPGIIIGKKGSEIEKLKVEVQKITNREVYINITEVQRPEVDAQLIAENICQQLLKRVAFRRAMKRSVSAAMKFGAKGIKISCSGRLGGAEIARTEWYREGRVPLHTLRADIDYGFFEAKTTYGIIGVKVLVYRGETLTKGKASHVSA